MEGKTKERIEKTVRELLEESDMSTTSEYQIRKTASEKLDINLSESPYKAFVRSVVESFLHEQKLKQEEEEEEEEEAKHKGKQVEDEDEDEEEEDEQNDTGGKEYDDDGNLVICKLSSKRKVTIQDFKGMKLVSIREYYYKDGKDLPTAKGISLTEEQWSVINKNIPAIDEAIKKMQSRV
ncbi:hypothetical protein ACFE04_015957 [Oxalis oulophora]